MKTLARQLWLEPVLFLAACNAAVQAVQLAVIDPSTEVSLAILFVGTLLQALGSRAAVEPVAKRQA